MDEAYQMKAILARISCFINLYPDLFILNSYFDILLNHSKQDMKRIEFIYLNLDRIWNNRNDFESEVILYQ